MFCAINHEPDGVETCTIRHFKAFFMPHNRFACLKGLWQAVLSVICILSIFKLFFAPIFVNTFNNYSGLGQHTDV